MKKNAHAVFSIYILACSRLGLFYSGWIQKSTKLTTTKTNLTTNRTLEMAKFEGESELRVPREWMNAVLSNAFDNNI
jgi:hypothetical protein